MYHISLYFDEKTNGIIRQHMKQVASKSGNDYIFTRNIPPHITISAFSTDRTEVVIDGLAKRFSEINIGNVTWVGVGTFLPHVIYITPILGNYLDSLSKMVDNELSMLADAHRDANINISPTYRPFSWMPHTTIAKNLSKEEMKVAFEVMAGRFGVFTGEVVQIGIAKTNPYENIEVFDLKGN